MQLDSSCLYVGDKAASCCNMLHFKQNCLFCTEIFLVEYNKNLEENLVKYSNFNGLIRRHFGKQIRGEIQLIKTSRAIRE